MNGDIVVKPKVTKVAKEIIQKKTEKKMEEIFKDATILKETEEKTAEKKVAEKKPLPTNEEYLAYVRNKALAHIAAQEKAAKEAEERHKHALEKRIQLASRLDSYARALTNCVTPQKIYVESHTATGDICIVEAGTNRKMYRIIITEEARGETFLWNVKVVRGDGFSDTFSSEDYEDIVSVIIEDMANSMSKCIRVS